MSSSSSSLSLHHLQSPQAKKLYAELEIFVREKCQPAEAEYERHLENRHGKDRWTLDAVPPCMERLKREARELGLWNLFVPHPISSSSSPSIHLTNLEYGIFCETMGRSFLAPEACNCSAPDTGNMEVLLRFGSKVQKDLYLKPLLKGTMRSCFLMTEPEVSSSDATNIQTVLKRVKSDGEEVRYVLSGRKWWGTGAMDPRCGFALVLARMEYEDEDEEDQGKDKGLHGAHTVVLVPMNHPRVRPIRPLTVFGYDDAPHGHAEVLLDDVELDSSALILGEGRGFEIAQARLGPGRIHHCMRAVGMAARCHELMLQRSTTRTTFGKLLCEHGGCMEMIADSASDLQAARLLTLDCAHEIDVRGAKAARGKIASIKVTVPELTGRVADRAVQVHGGAGVSGDFPLARILAGLRTLRIADGPDAVHKRTVAKLEVKKMLLQQQSRL